MIRKIAVSVACLLGLFAGVNAAQAPNPRGGTAANTTQTATSGARSAVSARSASKPISTTASSSGVTARGAGRTTVSRGTNSGTSGQTVTARAASTQKVINSSTKVASATKNVIVSEACRQKYDGCMDSFCMIDNDNGGRCICSDRNAELDSILAEIEKLDQQSYQMATAGVEQIEMGADADAVMTNVSAIEKSLASGTSTSSRKSLDLSAWDNTSIGLDVDDIWGDATQENVIDGKTGDALYRASHELCVAQIPECANELSMLQLMYSQQIKSDCTAYENSLKQQKNASANKLASAQQAMRQAALEQYRNANKYDLGQCTTEFKKCMISTGGCGDDFSKCASVAAFDNTNANKTRRGNASTYTIQGATTTIEISSSTYDTLYAKKPLCENVTKQCMSVADQVWDTFLREVAPQVKSAELIAENETRQNCIGTISNCFQKACKDTIDPNNPDGSYDMCLSRPETMLNVCKVPLNACGIDATSAPQAAKSEIWNFVLARLSSMRADACTSEVKECLQSSDRCGKDYSQCVGLDTDTIVRMCPTEKLTACVQKYNGNTSGLDEYLETVAQGIMLNIDNSMLTTCQNAANAAMVRVCGDTENCDGLVLNDGLGARSLEYKLCEYKKDSNEIDYTKCRSDVSQITDEELGRTGYAKKDFAGVINGTLGRTGYAKKDFVGVINGTIAWENLNFDEDTGLLETIDNDALTEDAKSELSLLVNNINNAIKTIESDQTVYYCMTGRRRVQGLTRTNAEGTSSRSTFGSDEGRFTSLTQQMRALITASAVKKAQENYHQKLDELTTQMAQDYVTLGERVATVTGENSKDARREAARLSCIGLADGDVFTTARAENNGQANPADGKMVGSKTVNEWNYKEVVTSTFDWNTLNCHRCVRKQYCGTPRHKWCKKWNEATEDCTDVQF